MSEQPRAGEDDHAEQPDAEDPDAWKAKEAAEDKDVEDVEEEEEEEEEELVLDPKHLLIVKDGTIRVAESLDDMQRDGKAGDGAKAFGTWTRVEHERFLKAMEKFPKGPWKSIAEMVGTRTVRQTQTHAQKYREKMARRMRGLRNRNGTLQSAPVAPSAGQLPMYPAAPLMAPPPPPPPPVHADMATLAAIASSAPLLHAPAHYYPRTMPLRRMTLPLAAGMHPSEVLGPSSLRRQQSAQYPHPLETYLRVAPPQLVRSASEFDALSQSSISSAFLGDARYPPTWEAYGAASEDAESDVPDFDESMDFLMSVYSADPNQIGPTCAVSNASPCRPRDDDAPGRQAPPPGTAPLSTGDEPLRRRARTDEL